MAPHAKQTPQSSSSSSSSSSDSESGYDPKTKLISSNPMEATTSSCIKRRMEEKSDRKGKESKKASDLKNKLHIDVSRRRLSDKIGLIKRKYNNNLSKGNGCQPKLSKPHEQKICKLSKKISGGQNQDKKVDDEHNAKLDWLIRFNKGVGDPRLEDEIISDGLELIGGSKGLELEEERKQLRLEELDLYWKRVELNLKVVKLIRQ